VAVLVASHPLEELSKRVARDGGHCLRDPFGYDMP
jgi:hypothetical protein